MDDMHKWLLDWVCHVSVLKRRIIVPFFFALGLSTRCLAASFAQMAWNQKGDLYGYDDNRLLKGIEYVATYHLGQEVPYTTYSNSDVTQSVISEQGRGQDRPIWERLYNHYVVLKELHAPYTTEYAQKLRPEGGGGDYGPNSGGYDHLGFATLLYSLEAD